MPMPNVRIPSRIPAGKTQTEQTQAVLLSLHQRTAALHRIEHTDLRLIIRNKVNQGIAQPEVATDGYRW